MKTLVRFVFSFALLAPASRVRAADNPRPPGQKEILAESLPHIASWSPPPFPKAVAADVTTGSALVRIVVDETGKLTSARALSASAPAFGEAAVEAIKQWKFTPGVENGKRAATSVDVPMEFERNPKGKPGLLPPEHLMPRAAPRSEVVVKSAPLGEYPETLRERGVPGIVLFKCVVGADGRPRDLNILAATHADFVRPAIAAFKTWEFTPAMQGDVAMEAEVAGEIRFEEMTAGRAAVLAKNGITAPEGSVPEDQPSPRIVVDAIWPYDLLLKGEGGSAAVEFNVLPNGYVTDVKVVQASHPDFGLALAAAMAGWRFDPALRDGRGVEVKLKRTVEFQAVPLAASEGAEPLTRIVQAARAGAIRGGAGLDARLTPLYRAVPVVPAGPDGETKLTGEAKVDLVVDRDGRVRLPRVVSATHPSLGWAAATAVSQWVFQPPTRDGAPTEVKVQLPMKF